MGSRPRPSSPSSPSRSWPSTGLIFRVDGQQGQPWSVVLNFSGVSDSEIQRRGTLRHESPPTHANQPYLTYE